mgnify:CR=1 FL=1
MIKSKNLNKWIGYSGGFAVAAVLMVGCVSDVKKAEVNGGAETVEADSLDVSCLRLCPRFACVLARALRCAYGMRVKVWC